MFQRQYARPHDADRARSHSLPRAERQAILDGSRSKGAARLVLFALLHHANADGNAWPSLETLARETGMTRQGVLNGIRALRQLREVDDTPGGGTLRKRYHLAPAAEGVNVVDLTDAGGSTPDVAAVNVVDPPAGAVVGAVNAERGGVNDVDPNVHPEATPERASSGHGNSRAGARRRCDRCGFEVDDQGRGHKSGWPSYRHACPYIAEGRRRPDQWDATRPATGRERVTTAISS